MKNKKGFSLVELLAVVVILSIIALIAVPAVMKTIRATKTGISNYEKKNIADASERLIMEVINCEITDSTIEILSQADSNINISNRCAENKNLIIGTTLNNISVESLREKDYLNDVKSRCNGTISITVDSNNYKVTVDTSNVTCDS